MLVVIISLASSLSVMTFQANAQSCSSSDLDLSKEIRGMIEVQFPSQMLHINPWVYTYTAATVNTRILRIEGWTDTRPDYDKLMAFIAGLSCWDSLEKRRFYPTQPGLKSPIDSPLRVGAGCTGNLVRCGDICVVACSMEGAKNRRVSKRHSKRHHSRKHHPHKKTL